MAPRTVRPRRRVASQLFVVGIALASSVVVGCGSDGKTLRAPPPGVTAPLRPTSTTAAPGITPPTVTATPGVLSLTSTDFQPGGTLDDSITCVGEGRPPSLSWSELPEGTVEVGIVATDADDDLFTNWVVAGLDPASALTAGGAPPGAVESLNSAGEPGYQAFCPPAGETHLVEFTVYALSAPSGVTAAMAADEAVAALSAAPGIRAVVTASAIGS